MLNELKEKIKKDKPFSGLLNIEDIVALSDYSDREIDGRFLFYGISLQIKDFDGKFYKLRTYSSIEAAIRKERLILLVPHSLPKFYGRDRNYLLFEFLQGRSLTVNERPDVFFKIGKMCGEVNNLQQEDEKKYELKESYCQKINCIFEQDIVPYQNYQEIISNYRKVLSEEKYEVTLGFNDIQRCNFMIGLDDKLYFTDEDALEYNIKGYGFHDVIFRFCPSTSGFIKEYKRAFFLGYNSINSSIFLNQDYIKFASFLFQVDSALFCLRLGRRKDMEFELKKLLKEQHSGAVYLSAQI
jgi:hypothetical protein